MLAVSFFKNYLFSSRSGSLVRMLSRVSIIGITLSVAALIIVISVMSGMHANIQDRISGIEPHVMWGLKDVTKESDLRESLAFKELDRSTITRWGVYERHDLIVRTMDGIFRGVVARGWDQSSWMSMTHTLKDQKERGKNEFLDWLDLPLPRNGEIYMGYDLARRLGVIEGDPIQLIPPEGILLPAGEVPEMVEVKVGRIIMTSLQDVDETQIFFAKGKTLNRFEDSPSRELGMELWVDQPFQMTDLVSQLELSGAKVSTWKERNSSLFFALGVEKTTMAAFLSMSALISSFSIIIVLTLLLSQKKTDVAMLMAMGLSGTETQKLFATVGMLLSSLGLIAGFVLGLGVSMFLEAYPINVLPTDIYYDSQLPSQVDWQFVGGIFVTSVFVALFSSVLPVRVLARFRPVEILRR